MARRLHPPGAARIRMAGDGTAGETLSGTAVQGGTTAHRLLLSGVAASALLLSAGAALAQSAGGTASGGEAAGDEISLDAITIAATFTEERAIDTLRAVADAAPMGLGVDRRATMPCAESIARDVAPSAPRALCDIPASCTMFDRVARSSPASPALGQGVSRLRSTSRGRGPERRPASPH